MHLHFMDGGAKLSFKLETIISPDTGEYFALVCPYYAFPTVILIMDICICEDVSLKSIC